MKQQDELFNQKLIYKLENNIPFYIAEIGLNHNGNVEEAKALIEKAAFAGADAVKFQIFNAEQFYSVYTQSLLTNKPPHYNDELIQFFKRFELSKDEYALLQKVAIENDVIFFASCFDIESFMLLEDLDVPLYKIASSEVTNIILLEKIASTKKLVICSTGISLKDEIEQVVSLFRNAKVQDIVLLHCVSLYPVLDGDVNVKRVAQLKQEFNVKVGFSDHSKDTTAAMLSVACGAQVFEKHLKMSPDHKCVDKDVSLTPDEFARYIQDINRAKIMLGDGSINYKENEAPVALSARRSIYAACDIPAGTVITDEHIVIKRPGVGLSPMKLDTVVGKKTKCYIKKDMPITLAHIEWNCKVN